MDEAIHFSFYPDSSKLAPSVNLLASVPDPHTSEHAVYLTWRRSEQHIGVFAHLNTQMCVYIYRHK